GPGAPTLLVRSLEEAEVVRLEPRRLPLVAHLESGHPAAVFADEQLFGVARETGARGVDAQPASGPLVVVHRIALRRRDAGWRPGHARAGKGRRHLILSVAEVGVKVGRG